MPRIAKDKKTTSNAENDVAAGGPRNAVPDPAPEIRTFKSSGLPPIVCDYSGGGSVDIGNIADVAFFSGLFPGETPATLAIRILAGRGLGMEPAQALFDLETSPGPMIRYRPAGRTFEQTADDFESNKNTLRMAASFTTDRPKAALEPDPATPKPTLSAASGSNVVNMPGSEDASPSKENNDSANKRPVSDPGTADDISVAEKEKTSDRRQSGEARPMSETLKLPEALISALKIAEAGKDVGSVATEVVESWRTAIVELLADLNANADEKIKTFDAGSILQKRKMFDDLISYYTRKVAALRNYVNDRLVEDGKTSIESQKGFFLYAEVGLDPAAWTYTEAEKAAKAITDFLRSKK